MAATLVLRDPRARFSRTENRATLFSCLGETLWYLSGSDELEMIEHYIPSYRSFAGLPEGARTTPGAYGPRIFGPGGRNGQMATVLDTLRRKGDTRQAVIPILDTSDLAM